MRLRLRNGLWLRGSLFLLHRHPTLPVPVELAIGRDLGRWRRTAHGGRVSADDKHRARRAKAMVARVLEQVAKAGEEAGGSAPAANPPLRLPGHSRVTESRLRPVPRGHDRTPRRHDSSSAGRRRRRPDLGGHAHCTAPDRKAAGSIPARRTKDLTPPLALRRRVIVPGGRENPWPYGVAKA